MQNSKKGFVASFRASAREAEQKRERELRESVALEREVARQRKAGEREALTAQRERLAAEVEILEKNLRDQVSALSGLLVDRFSVDEHLAASETVSAPEPVPLGQKVARLSVLQRLSSAKRADHATRVTRAREDHAEALRAHGERAANQRLQQEQTAKLRELHEAIATGDAAVLASYAELLLTVSPRPGAFPRSVLTAYSAASRQLVVQYELPTIDAVPAVREYRCSPGKNEIRPVEWSSSQRGRMYADLIARSVLRSIREVFDHDPLGCIDVVVFNGHVEVFDPATGKPSRPCVVSVRVSRDVFSDIDLSRVEPVACLRGLHASLSGNPSELVPVRPVLEFSMVDPRFVGSDDVLSTLDARPNLMELTPSEFEFLITNLFEKMGLETRQTQASRDGGVDCVAFNNEPVLGGKVVIQAKRYKNTVGVSAVRDLFGTVQNEGASKGILVTTSGYGKASFDFARNKPLELLEGAHLLYLLSTHAGIEARIDPPIGWKDPRFDS